MRLLTPLVISLAAHVAVLASFAVPAWVDASHEVPAPLLGGDTFELPAPEAEVSLASGSPSDLASASPPAPQPESPEPAAHPEPNAAAPRGAPRASAPGRPSAGHAHARASADEATSGGASSGLYGAVGDRSAADLATTFTRGFPQAASGDPAWRSAPLGSAGEADVVLTLDETGHISDVRVEGAPGPHLAAGIRRTMALIRGRPFVARGRTTRLHLAATVNADSVHDGLHGEVFAIGGSFAGEGGSAFFALAIGRRIDLRVRLK